ncbi:MAG: hypothetical protein AAGF47_06675 [Planctomycetota bacterium]
MVSFLAVLAAGVLAGCEDPEAVLDRIQAASVAAPIVTTADELEAAFTADRITFESTLIRAEDLLDGDDPAAVAFAGATLELATRIEDRLPRGGEFELFWRRIGQLAYRAAFRAMEAGDWATGGDLVEAGPARWRRETYWRAYPNHDVLVAVALGQRGEPGAGIRRLQSRITQTPEMEAAIGQLRRLAAEQARREREADREALRQRLRLRLRLREGIEAGGG